MINTRLLSYNDYESADAVSQAWYREYDFAADHANGYYNGMSDKEMGVNTEPNKTARPYAYVLGYNAGAYLARTKN